MSAPAAPARRVSGLTLILGATALSGIASYVVQTVVFGQLTESAYAVFAAFWSFIYLIVGTLSGIQQEVTRGTRARVSDDAAARNRSTRLAVVSALLVVAAVVATAPLWVAAAFPTEGWALVWPLAFGTGSYVLVAVLCGMLYGIHRWLPLALLMTADAVLRLIAIVVVLFAGGGTVALAWAIAVPFPLAIVVLWPLIRRSVVGAAQLDAGYREVSWNVSRTMVAAVSTGIMVSGFPLVLGLTSAGESASLLGLYIFCITLARAPLIVVVMSLQSYLVVTFRDATGHFWRTFLRLQAVILGAGVLLAAVAWLAGPPVFAFVYPERELPDGVFLAVLVLSSALVGSLCVSGPAVLARSEHLVYAAGWAVAAATTVVVLLLPLDFTTRTVLSLLLGPIAGVVVFAVRLVTVHRSDTATPAR